MNNQVNAEEDKENKKLKRKYCACCFKKFGRNEQIACNLGRAFGILSFFVMFVVVLTQLH